LPAKHRQAKAAAATATIEVLQIFIVGHSS
jgi:hypothetical protein